MALPSPPRTEADGVAATALYCYGVTTASGARAQPDGGLGGERVEPVRFGDLAALTTRVSRGKVRARRADLLRHSGVLRTALEDATVLPLRFGVVFDDEEALVADFLRPRHDELAELLRELEGRVELRVSAFYREREILAEVVRSDDRIARLRDATQRDAGPATHALRLELGERVAAALQATTRRDAEAIVGRLRPLALALDLDEEPIEHQVLRASFLVDREKLPLFDRAMNELAESQSSRIDFKYAGPLPPHSFVSLGPEGR
jgi:hypothetical protein